MDILHTILLGIIEGITEFLPISSTFHLLFGSKLLNIPQTEFIDLFVVIIQIGAILAIITLFFKEFFYSRNIQKLITYSFVPTAIVGFIMQKIIKDVFFASSYIMVYAFIIMGFVFIILENYIAKKTLSKDVSTMSVKDAVLIGIFQSIAIVPGVSRSGSILSAMMYMGYSRSESAKYSFLLGVPTILAAGLLDIIKGRDIILAYTNNLLFMILGIIISFLSAYAAVKWFVSYLQKNTLMPFAYYRIFFGIVLLILLSIGAIK